MDYKSSTLSRKSLWGQKKLLHMGPWNSKSLGDFLQHMQKSEFFNQVFGEIVIWNFFLIKLQLTERLESLNEVCEGVAGAKNHTKESLMG